MRHPPSPTTSGHLDCAAVDPYCNGYADLPPQPSVTPPLSLQHKCSATKPQLSGRIEGRSLWKVCYDICKISEACNMPNPELSFVTSYPRDGPKFERWPPVTFQGLLACLSRSRDRYYSVHHKNQRSSQSFNCPMNTTKARHNLYETATP